MPELPRQVIRERSFERELRALIRDAREADDFVDAAEFVLARDPEAGLPLGDGLWFADGSDWKSAACALLHVRRVDCHTAGHRERLKVALTHSTVRTGRASALAPHCFLMKCLSLENSVW